MAKSTISLEMSTPTMLDGVTGREGTRRELYQHYQLLLKIYINITPFIFVSSLTLLDICFNIDADDNVNLNFINININLVTSPEPHPMSITLSSLDQCIAGSWLFQRKSMQKINKTEVNCANSALKLYQILNNFVMICDN